MAGSQPLKGMKLEDIQGNIVLFRVPDKNSFFGEGFTLVYFMDSEESAEGIKNGSIPYLMVPQGTFMSGGSPITDVWKKRFQQPGTEHILGLIQGRSNDEDVFVDMVSVRPGYQRNGIASAMVNLLKHRFPKAKLSTSGRTEKGQKFFSKTNPDSEEIHKARF